MKRITFYIKKFWLSYTLAIGCLFIAIALDMFAPQITRVIVNEVFVGNDFTRFGWLLAALVAVGVGRSFFGYWKEFTFDRNCISTRNRNH